MVHRRRLRMAAVLVCGLGFGLPTAARGEDSPRPVAPDPAHEAALARAKALDAQVVELARAAKPDEALAAAREALALREAALGPDDPVLAQSLHNIATLLSRQGAHGEAVPVLQRKLAILSKAHGEDSIDVASTLSDLARALKQSGSTTAARPLYERALAIYEREHGPDHLSVATLLNNLAALSVAEGAYADARRGLDRALAIREQKLGPDDPVVAVTLNNLGALVQAQGAHAAARAYYERALAIRERRQGEDPTSVAESLGNLAVVVELLGESREAQGLSERALAIRERTLGKDHPLLAINLANLAKLLRAQGDYAGARPLLERALSIQERALSPEHPEVANTLMVLADLFAAQGSLAEAQSLYERALAIRERVLKEGHPDIGLSLNNLGALHRTKGALEEAQTLLERALKILTAALGETHPDVAACLNNLGAVFHDRSDITEAGALLDRVRAIEVRLLGPDHPSAALTQLNLAAVKHSRGAHAEARALGEAALVAFERALGGEHPRVSRTHITLGDMLAAAGHDTEARGHYERALTQIEAHARGQLAALSTRQRMDLLSSTRLGLDHWLLFAPRVGRSGYEELLRLRGLVMRAEGAERVLARRSRGDVEGLQAALEASQHLTARLANERPGAKQVEALKAWQRRYAEASAERERITVELAKRSAPLRAALERLDLTRADVQAQLGADAAVVEFLRVRGRYLAWLVRATGEPVRIDVGAADAIEQAAATFIKAIDQEGRATLGPEERAAAGSVLRGLVWDPIVARLGSGVTRVVLVPDAALASVPFAALPGAKPATYQADEVDLVYLSHAFDLVPRRDAAPSGRGAFAVGGVDYDKAVGEGASLPTSEQALALGRAARWSKSQAFPALTATRAEAERFARGFAEEATTAIFGSLATEAQVRSAVRGRRYVHIATHGFAREDVFAGITQRTSADLWLSADMERQLAAGHDPLLLSGLAFAGANPREGANGDDGILTALEASYLDLDGVDLVTLSACETARGTAQSGEGVLGLVSAFQMAGARQVVASLWKVDDEATRLLMDGFYARFLREERPLSPSGALREAALALRDHQKPDGTRPFAAPRYWAAFLAYGR